jgi:hypothetical protein
MVALLAKIIFVWGHHKPLWLIRTSEVSRQQQAGHAMFWDGETAHAMCSGCEHLWRVSIPLIRNASDLGLAM